MRLLRFSPVLLAGLLAGCSLAGDPWVIGLTAGAIPIFHRTPADIVVSAITGRDCSAVHLDRGEHYCYAQEKAPEPPVFCTRSLGVADCWAEPKTLPNSPRGIADGPKALTTEQEDDRTRRWPRLW